MLTDLQLTLLPKLPQRSTIVAAATTLWANESVVALWVGGSLASGVGDQFSDVDFRVAVDSTLLSSWKSPHFDEIFRTSPVEGQVLIPFGDEAWLHHLVLMNGEIFDFFVQSTARQPTREPLCMLGCRSQEFEQMLAAANKVPPVTRQPVDAEVVKELVVSFWLNSHKHRKVLGRGLELMATLGVHTETDLLLRLWYIEASGLDCGDVRRQTIHSFTDCIRTVEAAIGPRALALLGVPLRDRREA